MKFGKQALLCGLAMALSIGVFGVTAIAQDKTKVEKEQMTKDQKAEAKKAVNTVYKDVQQLIKDGKWEEVSKRMTKKASDGMCSRLVETAIAMQELLDNLPMEIPQLQDVGDRIADVVEKYKLDDIDIDVTGMMRMGTPGDESKADLEKTMKSRAMKNQKAILTALGNGKKRWTVVGELWKAQDGSPLAVNPLRGKIHKVEYDHQAVVVEVKADATGGEFEGDGGAMRIEMRMPPIFVRFEKHAKKGWLYAGIAQKRTERAMKEFMEDMQDQQGAEIF